MLAIGFLSLASVLIYLSLSGNIALHETINNESSYLNEKEYQNETENNNLSISEPVNWTTFSSDLGFSFEYPSEWGDVDEIIEDAVEKGTGSSGKTYSLSFSAFPSTSKNAPYGSGRSYDYSAGREYIFPEQYTLLVDEDKPAYFKSEITMPYDAGVIAFNLPQEEINGVAIVLPLLSITDWEKNYIEGIINKALLNEYSLENIGCDGSCSFGPLDSFTCTVDNEIFSCKLDNEEYLQYLGKGMAKYVENIFNMDVLDQRTDLDTESEVNIKIFMHIKDSVKLL